MPDPRLPIFTAARTAKGAGFTSEQVARMNDAFDFAGVPKDQGMAGFEHALSVILKHEGGYVDHPSDPGGATNLGVTKATWEGWVGHSVTKDDIRALTVAQVTPLYRKNYWDAVKGDDLPPALALCVFDVAVNSGPSRAAKFLQGIVGTSQDGKIGPATLAAVSTFVASKGVLAAVLAYSETRRAFYRSLSTFPTFGKGWLRRVDETEAEAKKLA